MRQIAATGCCNKSPCDMWKSLVWIRATYRSNKISTSSLVAPCVRICDKSLRQKLNQPMRKHQLVSRHVKFELVYISFLPKSCTCTEQVPYRSDLLQHQCRQEDLSQRFVALCVSAFIILYQSLLTLLCEHRTMDDSLRTKRHQQEDASSCKKLKVENKSLSRNWWVFRFVCLHLRSSRIAAAAVYHHFCWYSTLENKTPPETFPKFPSVLHIIDRSDQNPPITANSVTFWPSLCHGSRLWMVDFNPICQ